MTRSQLKSSLSSSQNQSRVEDEESSSADEEDDSNPLEFFKSNLSKKLVPAKAGAKQQLNRGGVPATTAPAAKKPQP
jgi:hypothetical protein